MRAIPAGSDRAGAPELQRARAITAAGRDYPPEPAQRQGAGPRLPAPARGCYPRRPIRPPATPVPARKTTRQPATGQPPRWRGLLLRTALFGLGLGLGFVGLHTLVLGPQVEAAFAQLTWQEPTRVYARPLRLAPGEPMDADTLRLELAAAGYREGEGTRPGSWRQDGAVLHLATRAFADRDGPQPSRRLLVTLGDGAIRRVQDGDGRDLAEARVDPARIATLHGPKQEERRLVRLEDVPTALLLMLQAVEDRDFKHHRGVDPLAILRAAWVNLRSGEVRQGGSTLTQQLVRSLYLTRDQTWARKINEAFYAVLIEARFDKRAILEAYLNEVYLGQQGGQAVHGVAAAAEFWFGTPLESLDTAQIALLVGLIQGPSYHDPRRHPERARQRRAVVLGMAQDAGILAPEAAERARSAPLGISPQPGLAGNRHPAFMELVRAQLARDYPEDTLRGTGLSVLTTLSPSAQRRAEAAVRDTLATLQTDRRPPLQGALVLSDARNGELLALVGGRDPQDAGFNRALAARRPLGSLLKPFVYMLALAQPGRYSLASVIDDAPVAVPVAGGQTWRPDNADGRSHGPTPLGDALARSYNQATVRLGLDIGTDRLARLLKALAGLDATPHPALLLGALDASPMAVAQVYQFLASGGQLQPLRAVHAVLDAQGRAVRRYDAERTPADPGDALAARLVGLALQDAVRHGTARSLDATVARRYRPAGKTGTSNDSRDSWFAGYTGRHLAVAWVGNDDNRSTGLMGASGAMRVWGALFAAQPSAPLDVGDAGLEWVWVTPDGTARTREDCPGARRYAFVDGTAPIDTDGCPMARLRDWFGRDPQR